MAPRPRAERTAMASSGRSRRNVRCLKSRCPRILKGRTFRACPELAEGCAVISPLFLPFRPGFSSRGIRFSNFFRGLLERVAGSHPKPARRGIIDVVGWHNVDQTCGQEITCVATGLLRINTRWFGRIERSQPGIFGTSCQLVQPRGFGCHGSPATAERIHRPGRERIGGHGGRQSLSAPRALPSHRAQRQFFLSPDQDRNV